MSIGSSRSTCLLYAICASSSLGGCNPSLSSYIARIRKKEAKSGNSAAPGQERYGKLRLGWRDRHVGGTVVLARVDDRRKRGNPLALARAHHDHALCRA